MKEVKLEENPSTEELVDLIYNGALELDTSKIEMALQYALFTIKKEPDKTPIFKLAYENSVESAKALDFLWKEFSAYHWILGQEMMSGYATCDHDEKAKGLLANARFHPEYIRRRENMCYGYAHAGN